ALLILLSFVFIAAHIRLGFLCEVVMLSTILFLPAGHPVDRWLAALIRVSTPDVVPAPAWLNTGLTAALVAYVVLLPLAKIGQYYNFLARKSLTGWAQASLERYTNFFGIIIWRVFSVDHTNFFARILLCDRRTGTRTDIAPFGRLDRATSFRFTHVGEFICLVSLFTTLKYYPANSELFVERLLRYARTIPCPPQCVLVFVYISIRKTASRFEYVPIAEYTVDARLGTVDEAILDQTVSVRAASPVS